MSAIVASRLERSRISPDLFLGVRLRLELVILASLLITFTASFSEDWVSELSELVPLGAIVDSM